MIINFSNENILIDKNIPSIFLAGPTKRNSSFNESWRKYACDYLEQHNFDGIIYVPEYLNQSFDESKIEQQCLWERSGLKNASIILFWIPREIKEMPAFTTNVEFGTYLQIKPNQIVYGRPNNAQKMRYLDWLYKYEKKDNAIIYEKLEDCLDVILEKFKNEENK